MIETMRFSQVPTPWTRWRGLVGWLWKYLWYLVNFFVAGAIATGIGSAFRPQGFSGVPLADIFPWMAWSFLFLFFWLVYPPIPKIELWLRALLARAKAGRSGTLKEVHSRSGAGRAERPRQAHLKVSKREISHRRPSE